MQKLYVQQQYADDRPAYNTVKYCRARQATDDK